MPDCRLDSKRSVSFTRPRGLHTVQRMSTLPLFDDPHPDPRGGKPAGTGGGSGGNRGDGEDNKVYRVSQLNRAVRAALERRWGSVWVHGEISDFSLATSGHAYFTLNDEDEPAQLRVVLFRTDVRRSKARLEDGARVKLQGQLSLFTPRGSYQMIARIALPEGLGELHAQFERVRKKLDAEGLLAADRKRALPHLPRVLGVVTSAQGAALHDVIRVVQARSPTRIVIAHCVVQGASAPGSIIRALRRIQKLPALDAVIVGRGGGAAEDLVAFNDERVARAIANCRVPVISAVGHEVDVTIADLVADVRAATPSNAAELAVPDRRALLTELLGAHRQLKRAVEIYLGRARLRLARSGQRLRDPRQVLRHTRQRLKALDLRAQTLMRALLRDDRTRRRINGLDARAQSLMRALLRDDRTRLAQLSARLARCDPRLQLAARRQRLSQLQNKLGALGRALPHPRKQQLARFAGQLMALSPLASLARGYAIVLHEPSGRALLRASEAQPGDGLQIRLHDGTLRARVEPS